MTKPSKARTTGTPHEPLVPLSPAAAKQKRGPAVWGPIAIDKPQVFPVVPETETAEVALVAAPVADAAVPAPPKRRARTFKYIFNWHQRPDGKRGFTYRDLCPALHVAAESLRGALEDPGRLTVHSVMTLAGLMGENPMVLLADIMAEIYANPGARAAATRKARTTKPRTKPADEQLNEPGNDMGELDDEMKVAQLNEPGDTGPAVAAKSPKKTAPKAKAATKTAAKAGPKKGKKKKKN